MNFKLSFGLSKKNQAADHEKQKYLKNHSANETISATRLVFTTKLKATRESVTGNILERKDGFFLLT